MSEPASSCPAATPRRSLRRPLVVGALLIAAAALVAHALAYGFVCDDAYISFRYAHNLAYHGELSFNLGERVEGYTNFLWTVILALLLKLGLRPEVTSLVLGALCGVGVLVGLFALTRLTRRAPPSGFDLFGALLLPTWGSFAVWCSGGLETQLFTALALLGITLYVAERAGRVRLRLSGLAFALATMARPEGLLLFGLTGLHWLGANLLGERRFWPRRGEWAWIAGFLLPFGAFMAWRYSYYGYPFPNTFYAKSGGGWATAQKWGLPYLWDFVHLNRLYALAALGVIPLLLHRRLRAAAASADDAAASAAPAVRGRFLWSYLVLIALTYTGYVAWMGGDFMAMGRFFVPVVPLIAFFAQEGLRATARCLPHPRLVGGALAALLLAGGAANSVWLHGENQKLAYHRWGLDTIAYLKKFADDRVIIGSYMRRHLPADTYITVGGAGATVYASRLRALDAFGLSDEWIAHEAPLAGDRPGHSKFAPERYVLQQKPDLICHIGHHQDWPYQPTRGEAALWRGRGYRWACLAPEGVRPRYYCCLKRISRDLGRLLIEPDPR